MDDLNIQACNGYVITGGVLVHDQNCPLHGSTASSSAELLKLRAMVEEAWGLICNADMRTIDERDDEWGEAARRFRERYFAWLKTYVSADPS